MLGWFGTASSIIGAFLVASHVFIFGYWFFLAGSISWIAIAIHRKDKSLATLNGFFLISNILGIMNAV